MKIENSPKRKVSNSDSRVTLNLRSKRMRYEYDSFPFISSMVSVFTVGFADSMFDLI